MTNTPRSPISALGPFVESGALAGAVTLVTSKEKTLSLEAIGYADLAQRQPMRTDQMFWIASMTKPIAATLLMMLVDEGKIDLDDRIVKYLPEFNGQMVEKERNGDRIVLEPLIRPITVADVLRHTSGMSFLSRLEPKIDVISLRESCFAAAMSNLVAQPGTQYLYSNSGSNVGGRLVEVVAGTPFEKFLDERLLIPLAMTDTTFWPTDEQVARLARTYKPDAQKMHLEETTTGYLTYPVQNRSRHVHPGGGLFSTASDVSQFCRMILNGGTYKGTRYLSSTAIRKMTSTQTGKLIVSTSQPDAGYGLGWGTTRPDPGNTAAPLVGKAGHGGALSTSFWLYPEHELATIFMVQHQGYAGEKGDQIAPAFEAAAIAAFAKA
jgi:CubicO group peptidase (beta-lactamase class C family)